MGARRALATTLALLCLTGWSLRDGTAQAVPGNAPSTDRITSALGWQTGEQVFQTDGGRSFGAILASLDAFPSPQGPKNAALVVNCARGVLTVVVMWPKPMTMDVLAPQDVQWRFDNGPPQGQSWMTLPNANASSSPSPRDFLEAMHHAHKLVIGTSDHGGGGKVEASFDLDGGESALYRQVRAQQVVDRVTANCPD